MEIPFYATSSSALSTACGDMEIPRAGRTGGKRNRWGSWGSQVVTFRLFLEEMGVEEVRKTPSMNGPEYQEDLEGTKRNPFRLALIYLAHL